VNFAVFCHSLVSDWNHGNAHFLRGIVSELQARGHAVRVFEPEDGWSRQNLLADHGPDAIAAFERVFPNLRSTSYGTQDLRIEEWLAGIDLAIVHEWNEPALVDAIGRYRRQHAGFRALFHDTHHRALSAQQELSRFNLSEYDGVLAYGASLKEIYQRLGWGSQVHVWHEAADVRVFYPREKCESAGDVIWVGNWGDEERTEELREFFIEPVRRTKLRAQVYGVRYPDRAKDELAAAGIGYGGWMANFKVPKAFARFRATVHVPRRLYTRDLSGIPTIRPFEALACGIPLVSAPWEDTEGLFRIGTDFLMVESGAKMEGALKDVTEDAALASSLTAHGLETIRARHTCAHRVDELLRIYDGMKPHAAATIESLVGAGVH
jgi:spore maturation protein CgeB